ncbi:hypothetical protein LB941_02720 [Ligilactobacillus sp. WILCCON 0076]|uniref:Flagellar assembly protein FliH/Type III secretion system HrpE domain-containing protein n=1 Tax=Ligilactobacillus ubinensis TaxID=2876789 RepID=A0A9X2FIN0_9LACO|nr:FliH/SctL family protein [Ligilactobacillus ubinensis]MCP0886250.1 hypothetical protein [Ligilactobacillus ubinensis]
MQLSSNVVKQKKVMPITKDKKIITVLPPKKISKKSEDIFLNVNLSAEERELMRQSQEGQEKLEKLKNQIINDATLQAEKIKKSAYEQGFKTGKEAGYTAGYEDGLTEGKKIADNLIDQTRTNIKQVNQEINEYVKEKKNDVITYGVKMAEILINKKLEIEPQTILNLIEPVLFNLEKPDQVIIIRAHNRYHMVLTERLEKMKKNSNIRFAVLDDNSMGNAQIKIESEDAVVTANLTEELKKFLNETVGDVK